jgi:hypothetical protein
MGEQGNPFLGLSMIPVAAAHQLMLSIRPWITQALPKRLRNLPVLKMRFNIMRTSCRRGWTLAVHAKNNFQPVFRPDACMKSTADGRGFTGRVL